MYAKKLEKTYLVYFLHFVGHRKCMPSFSDRLQRIVGRFFSVEIAGNIVEGFFTPSKQTWVFSSHFGGSHATSLDWIWEGHGFRGCGKTWHYGRRLAGFSSRHILYRIWEGHGFSRAA
jgi:hypothetical protein